MISYNKFEEIPADKLHLPRVNNGVEIIVFETVEQHNAYLESLKVWSKENYCNELNEAHNALFRRMYQERNYLSIGEIPIWEDDEDYSEESLALQEWWRLTCKLVENHLSEVTEETSQHIETFINSLPKFNH